MQIYKNPAQNYGVNLMLITDSGNQLIFTPKNKSNLTQDKLDFAMKHLGGAKELKLFQKIPNQIQKLTDKADNIAKAEEAFKNNNLSSKILIAALVTSIVAVGVIAAIGTLALVTLATIVALPLTIVTAVILIGGLGLGVSLSMAYANMMQIDEEQKLIESHKQLIEDQKQLIAQLQEELIRFKNLPDADQQVKKSLILLENKRITTERGKQYFSYSPELKTTFSDELDKIEQAIKIVQFLQDFINEENQ